ncbi:UDP-N-acetylmuramate dehydrogenase [Actinomyces slackii]|uniref:UDP-N-acetylenolpyruvoylglucosamine reductase n=1 Tax=Actinomyces slackii TaxID=52774 RepID=A0A3S4WI59_9ACTO|nr:UDP-N-acetylmuramate dehydrogenase [Actinomyces slackii]VEG73403.1 UDP-N-acetylenolpyruvoylglucosamine reductase [Actinomyces slackii]
MTQPDPVAHPQDAQACDAPAAQDPGAALEPWPQAITALARPLGGPAPTSLAELTTMGVGGPIAAYVEATSEAEIIDVVRQADEEGRPLLVIGGGSNILAGDAGFDGVVLRDARQEVRVISDSACGGVEFAATAGTCWDDLVRQAIASHWGGFAPLSGIPGTVGAAPVQNIGAYGAEVCELLASVRAWDRCQGRIVHLPLADLALSYRDSDLKRSLSDAAIGGGRTWGPTGRWVVLEVAFHVRQASLAAPIAYSQLAGALGVELGARLPAAEVRQAVLELRASKGMVLDDADPDTRSAGSFFTNPILDPAQAATLPPDAPRFPLAPTPGRGARGGSEDGQAASIKTSAAWLIDHAGFPKGFALGERASLSTKHVLALTNRGGASGADLAELRDAVVAGVRERFGVTLVPEPVHVGW